MENITKEIKEVNNDIAINEKLSFKVKTVAKKSKSSSDSKE